MKKSLLDLAVRAAKAKNHLHPKQNGFRHFTFVIQNNQIIEMGVNRESEPLLHLGYNKFCGRHAEVDALNKAKGILDKNRYFHIINIRLNKRGELRMSKPCEQCYNWLTAFDCKSIFYSTDDGFEVINL